MKTLLLLTISFLTSFVHSHETRISSNLNLIEQEEEPKNVTDINGKKQGPWLYLGKDKPEKGYPEEGKIEEGPYLDDHKNGIWTKYHKDGLTPRLVGTYVHGRAKGEYTKTFENGQVKETGTRGNKKMTGSLKRYFEDGQISQEKNFNDLGKENGVQKMYYPNGQIWLEYESKNGVKTGKQIRYTETGEVKQVITYAEDGTIASKEEKEIKEPVAEKVEVTGNGPTGVGKDTNGKPFEKNGFNKTYNTDKELEMDGKFKNGKLWDGKLYKYDSDGILLKIEIWKLGKYHSEGQL
jgi:antitoxin component YwqK of YwqJK toxin-antitoxin module